MIWHRGNTVGRNKQNSWRQQRPIVLFVHRLRALLSVSYHRELRRLLFLPVIWAGNTNRLCQSCSLWNKNISSFFGISCWVLNKSNKDCRSSASFWNNWDSHNANYRRKWTARWLEKKRLVFTWPIWFIGRRIILCKSCRFCTGRCKSCCWDSIISSVPNSPFLTKITEKYGEI
jgi:hypothetical protein